MHRDGVIACLLLLFLHRCNKVNHAFAFSRDSNLRPAMEMELSHHADLLFLPGQGLQMGEKSQWMLPHTLPGICLPVHGSFWVPKPLLGSPGAWLAVTMLPSGPLLVSAQPFQGPWWLHSKLRLTFPGKLSSEFPSGAGDEPRAQAAAGPDRTSISTSTAFLNRL